MSVSRHPVALAIERRVGPGSRLLATVMALPLLDGLFPTLLLAGALDSPLGILEVGLLVFGGSATLAVVLVEFDGDRRDTVRTVAAVGVVVVALAAVEAAVAPSIARLVDLATLQRFAAVVVLAVAARTASARLAAYLPRPAVIVGLGLVASIDPSRTGDLLVSGQLVVADPAATGRGILAAAIGAGFAVCVAALGPWIRGSIDIDRFRFGCAVALGTLALSLVGLVPAEAPLPLAVFAVSALLALDARGRVRALDPRRGSGGSGGDRKPPGSRHPPTSADGGHHASPGTVAISSEESTVTGPGRPPWL